MMSGVSPDLLLTLVWLWALVAAQTAASQSAPCSFNSLCSCKAPPHNASRDVSCVAVPLARMPDMPAWEVTHMDVVSGGLQLLEAEALGDAQVESLRLMGNGISYLADRALTTTGESLRSLDLSYNALDEVPFAALRPLRHLDWLNLHSNAITSLDGDWSMLCSSLTNIFLGDNDLTQLQHSASEDGSNGPKQGSLRGDADLGLSNCEQVTWLNLDNNKLSAIPPGQLPPALQTLSASYNLIQKFPTHAVDELGDLAWLYLRGNYIEELPDYTFHRKKKLDRLDLGENSLSIIPDNFFNNTLVVRDLNLDNNFIKTIPLQAFRGFNTARMYLSMNYLESMDDRALLGLGHTLEYLDLGHNNFEMVPKALSQLKRLRYLYMPSNKITELMEDDLSSFSIVLKGLSLQGNKLNRIPKEALKDCKALTHLNIGYNQIYEIESDAFTEWGMSLDTVLLRSNLIGRLGAHSFKDTPRLRELSLSFNKLSYIHPEAFAELSKSLQILEISFSLFREDFPEEIFKPLSSLQWLVLDNNYFRTISSTSFYNFGDLQYLNLEGNRIGRLPPECLHPSVHSNLRDVRLSFNLLETIEPETFSSLQQLQTIVLSGNKLKSLQTNAFRTLPSLMTLVLSENIISVLEPRSFSDMPNVMKIDLHNNEIKELPLSIFYNVSGPLFPMTLNLSRNQLSFLYPSDTGVPLHIKVLDLSHNKIAEVPVNFLQSVSVSLRRLHIDHNKIGRLDYHAFGILSSLEILTVQHNNIITLRKGAFDELINLQVLDLSHNYIEQVQVEQFTELVNLRILSLSSNLIRSLSRDVFRNTRIEKLDLSHNEFVALPNSALSEIGFTLRVLDISHNNLEHLDSTMFSSIAHLIDLNLSYNRLTILPDNAFNSLGGLLRLDLGGNPLRANYKELFHYVHRLRHLGLAKTGMRVVPHLPLPRLVSLNLSYNAIEDLTAASVESLYRLKILSLANNKLARVPAQAWHQTPLLKSLDLSGNPIKVITKDSFGGLQRLERLDVRELPHMERFDADTLTKLPLLSTLLIQTWPSIERYRFRLGSALSNVPALRRLSVHVLEPALTDQLLGAFNPKLKHIDITGPNIKSVAADAFDGVEENKELALQLRGTQLESLPPSFFAKLCAVPHLSLDLRDNRLHTLSPFTLYPNGTNWENIGTRLIAGGLVLKGNPWVCDCSLVWLGQWMRRWLRETMQIHTVVLEGAQEMQALAREATCSDPATGQVRPLLDLYPEDLSCHVSALSSGATRRITLSRTLVWLVLIASVCW